MKNSLSISSKDPIVEWIDYSANIPFKTEISLLPIIDYWRGDLSNLNELNQLKLAYIEEQLAEYPFLCDPIVDISELLPHNEFLMVLFNPLISEIEWKNDHMVVAAPFSHTQYLQVNAQFQQLLEDEAYIFDLLNREQADYIMIIAIKEILEEFYHLDIASESTIHTQLYHKRTRLSQYFQAKRNGSFIRIKHIGELPHLDERALQSLLSKPFEAAAWKNLIPFDKFIFSGIDIISYVNQTTEIASKRIQFLFSQINGQEDEFALFEGVQQEIRNILQLQDVKVGIAPLHDSGILNAQSMSSQWNSLFIRSLEGEIERYFPGSFYEEVIQSGTPLLIEDLRSHFHPVSQSIVGAGYTNLYLAPLMYRGKAVGLLELLSLKAGALNGLSSFQIQQIFSVFTHSLKIFQAEHEKEIESEMLARFTAIHPSVTWKFREAVKDLLYKGEGNAIPVFREIYPFYGSLEIRDFSDRRSKAGIRDLIENLEVAFRIFNQAFQQTNIPIFDELGYNIGQKLGKLKLDFSPDDEVIIVDFIQEKINPAIEYLVAHFSELKEYAQDYINRLDSDTGIFFAHRKNYESILEKINLCIADCLEEEEAKLQSFIPCLFETFQSVGVEYNLYLGESLSTKHSFLPLFVEDIRLRQIKWTAKIMKEVKTLDTTEMVDSAPQNGNYSNGESFQIAPILLEYGNPISLKFDKDKKKLVVDGSLNSHFEMLKNRVNESTILGSNERLAQPQHISVIYSQDSDANIYRRHFRYLADHGTLHPEWEEFQLEPVAGVEGLKAFRINPIL